MIALPGIRAGRQPDVSWGLGFGTAAKKAPGSVGSAVVGLERCRKSEIRSEGGRPLFLRGMFRVETAGHALDAIDK